MESVNEIRNELRGLNSPLADMPRIMPYEIAQGYFESFNDCMGLIKAGKKMPYEVPVGYFDSLAGDVLLELNKPRFARNNPFDIPAGYFDTLPTDILAKAKHAQYKPKTISIGVVIWENVRWAAAAILLLGIGLGVYSNYISKPVFDVNEQLAMVSQDVINDYVQLHIDEYDIESIVNDYEFFEITPAANQLSNEEIENYINESGLL